jgi:hypothetical protein
VDNDVEGRTAGATTQADGDSGDDAEGSDRRRRLLRFAKRLVDRPQLAEDTRDLFVNVLNTSDKAKTEAVRMVAREVRHYLDELKLKEDLLHIMTSYSLEVSLSLKPLAPAAPNSSAEEPAAPEKE